MNSERDMTGCALRSIAVTNGSARLASLNEVRLCTLNTPAATLLTGQLPPFLVPLMTTATARVVQLRDQNTRMQEELLRKQELINELNRSVLIDVFGRFLETDLRK